MRAMVWLRLISGILAALFGLALLGFGLWAIGGAIYVVWGLFEDPASIESFARPFLESAKLAVPLEKTGEAPAYLIAWFIAILLLLVMGKLGDWSISAGARLISLGDNRKP